MKTKVKLLVVSIAMTASMASFAETTVKPVQTVITPEKARESVAEVMSIQSEIALQKLKLESLRLEQELSALSESSSSSESDAAIQKIEEEMAAEIDMLHETYSAEIEDLKGQVKTLRKSLAEKESAKKDSSVVEKVYVTSVRGMGDELSAHVVFGDVIMIKGEGSMINSDIRLEKIDFDGIWVKFEGEKPVFRPLMTENAISLIAERERDNSNRYNIPGSLEPFSDQFLPPITP